MTLRGSEFTQNRLDVTELADQAGAALDRALSSVFAEKAFEQNFEDRQAEIALSQGQLNLNQVNRIINDARVTENIREEQTAKSKEMTNTMMFIALLDQLEDQADWHAEQAQGYEAGFEDRYGEDWREHMAQDLLDPEVLVRGDDETVEEYRARLERELIDELLNDDGSIKDEYKDHPEYRDWALWAQHRHAEQELRPAIEYAREANDPVVAAERIAPALENKSVQAHAAAASQIEHQPGDEVEATIEASVDYKRDEYEKAHSPVITSENGFG